MDVWRKGAASRCRRVQPCSCSRAGLAPSPRPLEVLSSGLDSGGAAGYWVAVGYWAVDGGAGAVAATGGCTAAPSAAVEGSIAVSAIIHAQPRPLCCSRGLQHSGGGQCGFAMKPLNAFMAGVAAGSSHANGGPVDGKIRMLQTSLQRA